MTLRDLIFLESGRLFLEINMKFCKEFHSPYPIL